MRFAGWLERSPDTATPDDVKHFQEHLIESGASICTRNQTMTGVKFLFRVTLRRHDLVAEIFSFKQPVKVPLVLSKEEVMTNAASAANRTPENNPQRVIKVPITPQPSTRPISYA